MRLLFILSNLLLVFSLHAQPNVSLKGIVLNELQNPLQNATVYVVQLSSGTYTDSLGQFELITPSGQYEVSISYIGYETQKIGLFLSRDTSIQVTLKTGLMQEVAISSARNAKTASQDESGMIVLKRESFFLLPSFLGENDPIKAVQMQPGIQSGNEGSRGVFVRGGSPDQNLMQVDGVPVYNPSHIYGFLSVFNGDAIERIDVYKDKYPARFGGRLGSVMDISIDEGNNENLVGIFSLGLVTTRLHLNGPLTRKKQTTFSFSGRVCYVGLYVSPISRSQFESSGQQGDISYYFGDVNVKIAHRFNERNKVEVNFFTNRDFYSFDKNQITTGVNYEERGVYRNDVDWSNEAASIAWINNWEQQWKLFNRIGFSRYNLNGSFTDIYGSFSTMTGDTNYYNNIFTETQTYIYNIGWNGEAAYTNARHKVRMGAGANALIYETGRGTTSVINKKGNDYVADSNEIAKAGEWFIYAEDEFQAHKKLSIGFGMHVRIYYPGKEVFYTTLPRINALYNPVAKFFLRASASGLSQNLHLLTASNAASNADILNDYWVPATANAPPETGWNFSAGMIQKLPYHFEWSIDGFYRIMGNLIEYKNEADYNLIDVPWEEKVVTGGKGEAYGAEFYIARTAGKVTGSVAYTLSWSNRKFDKLNRGEYFPYKYDRRHNLAAQINWQIRKKFEVGAAWVYGSGNAYTLATQSYDSWNAVTYHETNVSYGYYTGSYERIDVYTGRNNARLPAFHHLDLSFTYKKQAKRAHHALNLSVYNVYNRFNVFSMYADRRTDENGNIRTVYRQLSLFPILPSLTYTIKFSL